MAHKIIDRYTKETARKTFSAYDAIVQLALENCKIAHCDRETRTAALIRTESSSNDVRYDISGSDGLIQFPRGACESHSLFKSTVVGGSVGTLVDVPFPLIKGMYLFESLPGSGGGCFYSDKENEITCDARGCDTIYTGQMNNGATLPQKMYNKLKELKKAEEK